ncbi:Predicted flavoprotein CzcO associated with the cation diffusion facilitator CzcD [Pseudomonas pohangensis]|uniref:Predicted flavoprotein CzcO associated with the cation diffusion facilitator CzcD n=1 Tax=Pseudomonas pohangensis TaxID=364197 RepID=A0A1H2E9B7_9PSED|nr:NAD(P)/FAD-dependent oxidoreductase [Pseudomonas pohangensis]SDT91680.1 Predicted flavoprotein CzcO associated with the cation diffusion facilitator CzcD [Pseudomonas pohangensis]
MEHVDVLIVGAGISGIGAAVHLCKHSPQRSYLILESRAAIGGTWDLFRYPGIRSDSDMYTLGYNFKPWTQGKAIADGAAILDYLDETISEHQLRERLRLEHKVCAAAWDSTTARWTLEVQHAGKTVQFSCNFLYMCSGYYDFNEGYTPEFPGREQFAGQFVHPQHWPEGLDYRGKRVVVIGSGATAMTLVPNLAREAQEVVMLQRSPTYVVSRPAQDRLANRLRRYLPAMLAYQLIRWRNVLLQMFYFNLARLRPEKFKERLLDMLRKELGDAEVEKHFTPNYRPWQQRLCLVPDSDLFQVLRSGKARMVTGPIDSFTPEGIRLQSGEQLAADIIVSATGLKLLLLGGMQVRVDGREVDLADTFGYKGMMFSGVPNLAVAFGYTNASWTLKADLSGEYLCRLLNHMQASHKPIVTPQLDDPHMQPLPWLDFTSGYVMRARDRLPRQGTRLPWRLYQNYIKDLLLFRFSKLDDGVLRFSEPVAAPATRPAPPI